MITKSITNKIFLALYYICLHNFEVWLMSYFKTVSESKMPIFCSFYKCFHNNWNLLLLFSIIGRNIPFCNTMGTGRMGFSNEKTSPSKKKKTGKMHGYHGPRHGCLCRTSSSNLNGIFEKESDLVMCTVLSY